MTMMNPTFNVPYSYGYREQRIETDKFKTLLVDASPSYSDDVRLAPIIAELNEAYMEAIEPNWDGYNALPASPSALFHGLSFIRSLPSDLPLPEVGFDNHGDVFIEWDYGPRQMITIRVAADGTFNFASLVGLNKYHGSLIEPDQIPEELLHAITRVVKTTRN